MFCLSICHECVVDDDDEDEEEESEIVGSPLTR